MKILYLLEDGRFGGMAKMVLELVSQVNSRGIKTQIVIAKKDSETLYKMAQKLKLNVSLLDIRLLSKKKSLVLTYLLFFIPDLIKIITSINRFNPDIVYCNSSPHFKGVIAARLLGKKVIWHMHDTYQPKIILGLFQVVRSVFGVHHFVASSMRTIEYYNLPTQATLLSIPPVDTNEFHPSRQEIFSEKNSPYNIISVCNINPDKGIDTLINTAAKVNEERSDVCFNVVGLIPSTQAEYFRGLTSLSAKLNVTNVHFLGQREDIRILLSQADLYLCCSNNESGPISVFEAMAMEKPVVSTDVGDLRRIFEINRSGHVLPVGDSAALAEEILFLLNNPILMKDLGQRGRKTAEEHLDIRLSISNHLNFYRSVI